MLMPNTEGVDTHFLRVLQVCPESLPVPVNLVVLNTVLLAKRLDLGGKSGEVAVVDAGEHVVLNLLVETSREELAPLTTDAKVLSSEDLVAEEVGGGRVCAVLGQMIDLGIEHEAPTKGGDGKDAPDSRLPNGEDEPGPDEKGANVKNPSQRVSVEARGGELRVGDDIVVGSLQVGPDVREDLKA